MLSDAASSHRLSSLFYIMRAESEGVQLLRESGTFVGEVGIQMPRRISSDMWPQRVGGTV